MRTWIIAAALLAVSCATASANCLKELSLPGYAPSRSTSERGFTLTRPGAVLSIVTDSAKDQLRWRVVRPNGRTVNCAGTGPASILSCVPSVGGRGRPAGYHKIYISNRMARGVSYTITCENRE